jgi:hypothetical protein
MADTKAERLKAVEGALTQIERQFGKGSIMRLGARETTAMEITKGGDTRDWLFLAMAHGQLGHADEARRYYDRAAQGMPSQASLQRFRAEAAALLGIDKEQKAPDRPAAPGKL